jgi:hypothetical protein
MFKVSKHRFAKRADLAAKKLSLLLAACYMLVSITNLFMIDRQGQWKVTQQLVGSSELMDGDETSKMIRLHKCVLDDRRKLTAQDILLLLPIDLVWFFTPERSFPILPVVHLSLAALALWPVFLLNCIFRV